MHAFLEPLLRLFAALVSRGGRPRLDRNQYGPVLIYPLRPPVLVLLVACLPFAIYTLVHTARSLRAPGFHPVHPLSLALAVVLLPIAAILLSRTLFLDERGIHRRDVFLPSRTIPWQDLHHVERYQSRSAGKATFFLYAADDRTLITVPEMSYDTDHLLRTVRDRVPLPELPRRRRHWYGG